MFYICIKISNSLEITTIAFRSILFNFSLPIPTINLLAGRNIDLSLLDVQ